VVTDFARSWVLGPVKNSTSSVQYSGLYLVGRPVFIWHWLNNDSGWWLVYCQPQALLLFNGFDVVEEGLVFLLFLVYS
jgi:hypothetical protein